MTGSTNIPYRPSPVGDTGQEFYHHSQAQRVSTDTVIVGALRRQYPALELTVVPTAGCDLIGYASAGHASATPIEDPGNPFSAPLKWRQYVPPARRLDGRPGMLVDRVHFGKYMYKWEEVEFIMYVVDGRDGSMSNPSIVNNYILSSEQHKVDELLMTVSKWAYELHNETWVFDGGWWQKSAELWESAQKSEWGNVILDKEMKESIINDVEDFFSSQDVYDKLQVPWKRGIIYYGPPGNGKTISIKAMMHTLYSKREPIPTLYVRSLASYGGPEYAINQIFEKARQEAPCYLVFEDLDSIVTDSVRSYFLNEVDGMKENNGILMVGSTNHLDRLDDGITKRPSRFDRKYLFPNPDLTQRTAYAKFWQKKLSSNSEIEFPDELCPAVAKITEKFSFAFLQEAFVSSLLAIARRGRLDRDGLSQEDAAPSAQVTSRHENISLWVEAVEKMASPERELLKKQIMMDPYEYSSLLKGAEEGNDPLWCQFKSHIGIRRWSELEEQAVQNPDKLSREFAALSARFAGLKEGIPLWGELQKQIAILREGINSSQKGYWN